MSTKSDFCSFFYIPKQHVESFKNSFKAYLLKIIDDGIVLELFQMFYQIKTIPSANYIGFCLTEESIKLEYFQSSLDSFFDFLDSILDSEHCPIITYEARELCIEYLEFSDYSRTSCNINHHQLYIKCTIEGFPEETTSLKLIDWINK